jgi:hypothetical protein
VLRLPLARVRDEVGGDAAHLVDGPLREILLQLLQRNNAVLVLVHRTQSGIGLFADLLLVEVVARLEDALKPTTMRRNGERSALEHKRSEGNVTDLIQSCSSSSDTCEESWKNAE